jgi:hypothetical protein
LKLATGRERRLARLESEHFASRLPGWRARKVRILGHATSLIES